MSTMLDQVRFEIEYQQRFEAQKDEGATLWGNTPFEVLRVQNWRQWCEQATYATRFCTLCGFPRDPVEARYPDERCPICATMEIALFQSDYWLNLPRVARAD
jgi:hypothetical protein